MLRELENLLAEIARQQGLDVPQKTAPSRPREAARPDPLEPEIIEAEPVREVVRRPVAGNVPRPSAGPPPPPPVAAGGLTEQANLQSHDKFDQGLTQLDAETDAYAERSEAPQSPGTASQIVDWFRNPSNVRQAVIMNEILQRPVDRW